jgi:integrase
MIVAQIVAMDGVKPMSVTTINKNITRVSTLLNWAKKHGHIAENYAEGMGLKKKGRAYEERDAFTDEELKIIFIDNPVYKGNNRERPDHYWIPLIASDTGMRLEEICQPRKSDIHKIDDIWVI